IATECREDPDQRFQSAGGSANHDDVPPHFVFFRAGKSERTPNFWNDGAKNHPEKDRFRIQSWRRRSGYPAVMRIGEIMAEQSDREGGGATSCPMRCGPRRRG